jgi:hypothetical protein
MKKYPNGPVEHFDMHGNRIRVGDWLRYPWWSTKRRVYVYRCRRVKRVDEASDNLIYVHNFKSPSTPSYCEIMPENKIKREQVLLLKNLECPTL